MYNYIVLRRGSYDVDIFLASWLCCMGSTKASYFVNEWLSGTTLVEVFSVWRIKVVVLGFVVPVSVCVRGMSCLGLYACRHVRVRMSIIVIFLLYFCEGFFLFVFCVLYTWLLCLPVRQADVAFLTLFIGISGGKAWFISFGTNY
jgi:hypothetical protein